MAGTEGGMGLVVKIKIGTTLTALTYLLEGSELPKMKAFIAEATPHNATGGWAKRVHSGKRSLEPFKVVLGWDSDEATHAAVQTAFDSDASVDFSIVSPDGSDETIGFAGFIEELGRMTSQEDKYTAEVQITPTGKPTIT